MEAKSLLQTISSKDICPRCALQPSSYNRRDRQQTLLKDSDLQQARQLEKWSKSPDLPQELSSQNELESDSQSSPSYIVDTW